MPVLLPPLYLAFLAIQLYALRIHFPHPPSGLVYPTSIQVLKFFSVVAGSLSWTLIVSLPTSTAIGTTFVVAFFPSSSLLLTWTALTTLSHTFSVIFGRVTPKYVVSTAPFAHVRHPTYISYASELLGVVFCILASYLPTYFSKVIDIEGTGLSMHVRCVGLVTMVAGFMWLYRR